MVQVAGIRVGRVDDIQISGDHVTVDINVKGATLGDKTQASVQVLNLLGEKYLELTPKGSGKMNGGDTIPVSRTNGSYDIVSTLSELTTTTEAINIPQLSQALTTLGDTINAASPHIKSTFNGLSRISQAIASRDEGIQQLLGRADRVTKLLVAAPGRPGHADEAGRAGLQGADRAPRGHPRPAGQRRSGWRSSCAAWPPTTRPRSATRSSSSTRR